MRCKRQGNALISIHTCLARQSYVEKLLAEDKSLNTFEHCFKCPLGMRIKACPSIAFDRDVRKKIREISPKIKKVKLSLNMTINNNSDKPKTLNIKVKIKKVHLDRNHK